MWAYNKNAGIYKCPSDQSKVLVNGASKPRVRSISMSQVFAVGEWLSGNNDRSQTTWATFAKLSAIATPTKTFVFVDEHPDSINDSAFATPLGSNQYPPGGGYPGSAKYIDFPANFHNGGC